MDNSVVLFIWLVVIVVDLFLVFYFMGQNIRYWIKYRKVGKRISYNTYMNNEKMVDDSKLYLKLKFKSSRYEFLSWCALLFYNVNGLIYEYSLLSLFWTTLSLVFAILSFNSFKKLEEFQG